MELRIHIGTTWCTMSFNMSYHNVHFSKSKWVCYDASSDAQDRPNKTARPEERRRRPSDIVQEKDKEKNKSERSEKTQVSPTILSLVLPGTTYGLSHFLKGDREHLRQVVCESSAGLVYTLFAKDVAAHLSHKDAGQGFNQLLSICYFVSYLFGESIYSRI